MQNEINKESLKEIIIDFIKQSQTINMKYSKYKKIYRGKQISASFGKGRLAKYPWMAFLGYNQKVPNGIYPVLFLDKTNSILYLNLGVSVENTPLKNWKLEQKYETSPVKEYKDSFIFSKYYDIYNTYQKVIEYVIKDIDKMIDIYDKQF